MAELWFWLCALMIAVYVATDGFDFGAGMLHLFATRSDSERRQVLAAIGPYWDGNEVWLLASGGALFLAFPKVLAAGFSGFYMAVFLIVWMLILRGIAIEFRSHVQETLWRRFWDVGFCCASFGLPLLLGAALGNVLRGVPLDERGWFALPLFESFSPRGALGLLDWYTLAIGGFAVVVIALHGANYLVWKTDGPVAERARRAAGPLWIASTLGWIGATELTFVVNSTISEHLAERGLPKLLLGVAAAAWLLIGFAILRRKELLAFVGSSLWILAMLATTASCVFPVLLRTSGSQHESLSILNAASSEDGLRTALRWWSIGIPIALAYFALLFRLHRGKASAAAEGEGY
ncbi:MAG TPA: cytochrome d ubiquinol oxidase subunit II [Planctomycetota bacterium]|nr:cytochrome d ubiquinol oxidase subunit II [Planctomycetota bacterium]